MQQQLNHTPLKIELRAAGLDVACIDCRFFLSVLWRKSDAPLLMFMLYIYSLCVNAKRGARTPVPAERVAIEKGSR
jgi:hypothetical protein